MKRAFVALLLLTGCTFSREVVNPDVRAMDTRWIVPGKTTREEVVRRLGLPPAVRGVSGVRRDSFRWNCYDTMTRRFEAGYIVTPTFERGTEHYADDILIRFDECGVVTLVSRTKSNGEGVTLAEWREARK